MGKENGTDNGHKAESDLAFIDYVGSSPFPLFKDWHAEAADSQIVNPDALCFSTCTRDGKPSSRHLLLRRLDKDGFVIMTDGRSRKSKELAENPYGSIAFLWSYRKDNRIVNRQVRIEGRVELLSQENCEEIWGREPLFCKIRANLCYQGQPVDWEEHKQAHDSLYDEVVRDRRLLEMPNHVVFYKVIPTFMDFYYAYDTAIGDRLAFHAVDNDAKGWKVGRIAA